MKITERFVVFVCLLIVKCIKIQRNINDAPGRQAVTNLYKLNLLELM